MKRRLFIISDLHMGGVEDSAEDGKLTPGSALFTSSKELAAFFRWVVEQAEARPDEVVELVINGDIFDFLCAAGDCADSVADYPCCDEADALDLAQTLAAEYAADADAPLAVLREGVQRSFALTLLLGNHDVELSFPRVREWLGRLLNCPPGHLKFIYDGEAYAAGDVLIEHGNRYDPWNVIDHSALREDRSVMSRCAGNGTGREGMRFAPPAGSFIVTNVLNRLKRQYRFVDLLKPETEAVLPLLLTLCPPAGAVVRDIVRASSDIYARYRDADGVTRGQPSNAGYLSSSSSNELLGTLESIQGLSEEFSELVNIEAVPPNTDLGWSEGLGSRPNVAQKFLSYVDGAASFGRLLVPGNKEATLRKLRKSLEVLNRVDAFALDWEASSYRDAAERLARDGGFSVVVFGHTHLPKRMALDIDAGRDAVYINTGTWANVARIPAGVVQVGNESSLEQFARDLAANNYLPYVKKYLTYAEVSLNDNVTTEANLWQFNGANGPRSPVYAGGG